MQTYNIEGNPIINYINNTNAKLKIMSVPTKEIVEFPAFLTDLSQTFDAKWNTEEVFGRMDPIATYQSTKRTMSLGFDLPAGSLEEAKQNLQGCSELIKMVYPVYKSFKIADEETIETITTDNSGVTNTLIEKIPAQFTGPILSKSPLVRIKFANLITGVDPSGLLGWISGLSWKPNLEMGMFAADNEFYPKVIALSKSVEKRLFTLLVSVFFGNLNSCSFNLPSSVKILTSRIFGTRLACSAGVIFLKAPMLLMFGINNLFITEQLSCF